MDVSIEAVSPIICIDCPFFEVEQEYYYIDNKKNSILKCKHVNICQYVLDIYKERNFCI